MIEIKDLKVVSDLKAEAIKGVSKIGLIVDDKEFYEEMAGPFYNSAMHFVNYLENTYTDDILNNDEVIDLDLNKMLERANDTTLELFSPPTFPELIYINGSYSTHFHTDGKVIYDTENIQVLPGLSGLLANEKINKIFNGLTPIEARELLKQMSIYPKDKDQELDQVINGYRERQNVQHAFYKSIITSLDLPASVESIGEKSFGKRSGK